MDWRNRQDRYGLVHVLLHWLTAVAVIGLFALGIWMVDLAYYDSFYNRAPMIHKSVGMLLIGLVLFRIVWRLVNGVPGAEPGIPWWEARLAHFAHLLIYALLIAILISGYLIPTARGAPISVFGWFQIPALPALVDNQETIAGWWHRILAWGLMGLVAIHATAALKHHFFNRDNTLRRMLGMKTGVTRKTQQEFDHENE